MFKHSCAIFLFISITLPPVFSQKPMAITYSCSFAEVHTEGLLTTYEPSKEAIDIITEIMQVNVLEQNFIIKAADCKNALATKEGKQRYILYSTSFIENFKKEAHTKWAAYCVLAHEIGHHLNNHDLEESNPTVRKLFELAADRFAGSILEKLGANLDESQAGINTFSLEGETTTHPSKRARLEAIAVGWKQSKETYRIKNEDINSKSVEIPTSPFEAIQKNMILLKGGSFEMGSDKYANNQKPAHTVTLKNFKISRFEVTFAEYDKYCLALNLSAKPDDNGFGRDKRPVINISWLDAVKYCNWLSEKQQLSPVYKITGSFVERLPTANGYRLPTEAEWEYAATSGSKNEATKFAGSEQFIDVAVTSETAKHRTEIVGSRNANSLGLYDLSGNVWEWVEDCWTDHYRFVPQDGSARLSGNCNERVLRGGSWLLLSNWATVRFRNKSNLIDRKRDCGFRLAQNE